MTRRLCRIVAGAAFLLGSSVAAVAPATAATPPVKITLIQYDSPGADTGTNLSLNAEYVVIKNMTGVNRTVTGWTLKDNHGWTFTFPTFVLKPYAAVTIHTGKGTASSTHRYYGYTWYVWNNAGDRATLRNASGVLQHTCVWTSVGTGRKAC